MMQKKLLFLAAMLALILCAGRSEAMTSDELIAHAKVHDGQEVQYEGEPIGSVLKRGDFVWLNVNDGSNAIAVWMPQAAVSIVRLIGGYGIEGDRVEIAGVFHRACPQHGGALDIHAHTMTVLRDGRVKPEILGRWKVMILIVLLGVLACLLILHIFVQRRNSK